jgi:hypothetical protein
VIFGSRFGGLLDLIDMPEERRFVGPPDGSLDFSALTQHIGPHPSLRGDTVRPRLSRMFPVVDRCCYT